MRQAYNYAAVSTAVLLLGVSAFLFFQGKKAADDPSWLDKFDGKLYVKKSCDDNLDRVIDGLGVNSQYKSIIKSPRLSVVLDHKGGNTFNVRHILEDKSYDFQFQTGKEVSVDSFDGRKLKVVVLQNFNMLTEIASWTDGKGRPRRSQLTRVITDKEWQATTSVDGVSTVCVFKLKE